ncbi:glycosyltransferase family 4 protein [Salinibacterium sp. SYSU T00001]|uniref:glycosyltransferase family 4 protein n=1 Tax=Homoserinimonas sedimenticola TaxID=2986805 RepID=UPI002235FEFC|nr:glycosyltransferase family 1 protein [Salinibacterium sedimenticola]MCW4385057.1 glycosyltransferase family 4 protein [Salinibacterium sedimenticola]
MSTELRVTIDQLVAPVPGGIGRYTEELTRELIAQAPPECSVAGIVSAVGEEEMEQLSTLLPGLAEIIRLPLPRRELALAWRFGATSIPGRGPDGTWRSPKGMLHATSPLAPLGRHDRINDPGNQTVVTIHDVLAWTHPESLGSGTVAFHKAMAKRAQRHADAVVVPSHAVASELGELLDFGDRIRVIGGAVSAKLQVPVDAEERAARLALPERYIFTMGSLEPHRRLSALIESLAHPDSVDLPLLIAGPSAWGGLEVAGVAAEAGLAEDRVRTLGTLSDADLSVVLDRASVFVLPSASAGFGLPVVEAFSFGTPVVHSDAPALVEVAAGAGYTVPLSHEAGYPARLAQAIASIVDDPDTVERMRVQSLDRARAFSWADSAAGVWQLHAEL